MTACTSSIAILYSVIIIVIGTCWRAWATVPVCGFVGWTPRFVASLNEMNNIQAWRIATLPYHVPVSVLLILIGIAAVAMGFAGYDAASPVRDDFCPT
jgi:hypothetical protein